MTEPRNDYQSVAHLLINYVIIWEPASSYSYLCSWRTVILFSSVFRLMQSEQNSYILQCFLRKSTLLNYYYLYTNCIYDILWRFINFIFLWKIEWYVYVENIKACTARINIYIWYVYYLSCLVNKSNPIKIHQLDFSS